MQHSKKTNTGLKLNQDFRNRIEFIQDFDFPTACNQVEISQDQRFIIAAGVYPPVMKIYDVKELSMKCLRGMDA